MEEYFALWNDKQKAPHIETKKETLEHRKRAILGGYQRAEEEWEIIHEGTYEECSAALKKKYKQYYL